MSFGNMRVNVVWNMFLESNCSESLWNEIQNVE